MSETQQQITIDVSRIQKLADAITDMKALEAECDALLQVSNQSASKTGMPKLVRLATLMKKAVGIFDNGHPDNEVDKHHIQSYVQASARIQIDNALAPIATELAAEAARLKTILDNIAHATTLAGPGIAKSAAANQLSERLGHDAVSALDTQVSQQVNKVIAQKLASLHE